eukprot:gene5197-5435_t
MGVPAVSGSVEEKFALSNPALACSLCGQVLVAVGRKGGRVDISDAASGTAVARLQAVTRSSSKPDSKGEVAAVAFIPAAAGRQLQLVVATSDGVLSVCSSDDSGTWQAVDEGGSHLVVGSDGQQPALWELAGLTKVWQAKGGKPNRSALCLAYGYSEGWPCFDVTCATYKDWKHLQFSGAPTTQLSKCEGRFRSVKIVMISCDQQ